MSATDRMIAALERIAAAQEAMVAADPIAALGAVIGEMPEVPNDGQPVASNGFTAEYQLPDGQTEYRIVARRADLEDSRWTVAIERVED